MARCCTITVWLVPDFDDPSDREILITGFVGKTGFSDRLTGQIEIITKADALADIILPTIQPECGYQLGGPYAASTWRLHAHRDRGDGHQQFEIHHHRDQSRAISISRMARWSSPPAPMTGRRTTRAFGSLERARCNW
jgi:hypothetical protein